MRFSPRAENAFTLVEVLASLLLMAIALTGIIQGQSGSIKTVIRSEKLSQAYLLAQQKMTDIELELQNKNFEAMPDEQKGEFKSELLKEFRWMIKLDRLDIDCFLPRSNSADGSEMAGSMQFVRDILERTTRKIVVQVEWQEGEQTRFAKLAQLYVRFQDIPKF